MPGTLVGPKRPFNGVLLFRPGQRQYSLLERRAPIAPNADRRKSYSENVLLESDQVRQAEGRTIEKASTVRAALASDTSRPGSTRLRALLVEDNPADVGLVLLALRKHGLEVTGDVVQTLEEFTLRIRATAYDV